jgi:nitroreductase
VQNASAIVFILSDTLMAAPGSEEFKPSYSHSFDAGAAWALLALQATRLGYHSHGMTGVDFDRARAELAVPDRFRIEAAIAIGKIADKSILPQALQAREAPSGRKDIADFVTAGNFPA